MAQNEEGKITIFLFSDGTALQWDGVDFGTLEEVAELFPDLPKRVIGNVECTGTSTIVKELGELCRRDAAILRSRGEIGGTLLEKIASHCYQLGTQRAVESLRYALKEVVRRYPSDEHEDVLLSLAESEDLPHLLGLS